MHTELSHANSLYTVVQLANHPVTFTGYRGEATA